MAFKTLERRKAQTLTMGKEVDGKTCNEIEGVLISARTGIGRNNSSLYRIRTDDGIKEVWGNRSIDEALLSESGRGLLPEVSNKLIRISVIEMRELESGALVPECEVGIDTAKKAKEYVIKKPAK